MLGGGILLDGSGSIFSWLGLRISEVGTGVWKKSGWDAADLELGCFSAVARLFAGGFKACAIVGK